MAAIGVPPLVRCSMKRLVKSPRQRNVPATSRATPASRVEAGGAVGEREREAGRSHRASCRAGFHTDPAVK